MMKVQKKVFLASKYGNCWVLISNFKGKHLILLMFGGENDNAISAVYKGLEKMIER